MEWIVVIGRAGARIFERESIEKPVSMHKEFEYELGRTRNREMQKDRPGKDYFRVKSGAIPHSMTREKNPHNDAAVQFMREIADYLENNKSKKRYKTVTIVAGPKVAGILKKQLSKETEKLVSKWMQKNLSKKTEAEIQKLFEPKKVKQKKREAGKEVKKEVELKASFPVQIAFRDIPASEAVKTAIYERIEKLQKFSKNIIGCDVVISSPHKHSQKKEVYHIEIRLGVPGDDIYITREPEKNKAHLDIYVAIRDAFKALERQLEAHVDRMKGRVKKHKPKRGPRRNSEFLEQE